MGLGAEIKSLSEEPAGGERTSEPGLPPGQEEAGKSADGGVEVGGGCSPSWQERFKRRLEAGANGFDKIRKDWEGSGVGGSVMLRE